MKRTLKIVLNILLVFALILFQIYVLDRNTFFGVRANIVLCLVVIMLSLENEIIKYIIAGTLGVISDIIFSPVLGKYVIVYLLVVSSFSLLKSIYNMNSKWYLAITTVFATLIMEIVCLLFNVFLKQDTVNIFSFMLVVVEESLMHLFFVFVLYLLMYKKGKLRFEKN